MKSINGFRKIDFKNSLRKYKLRDILFCYYLLEEKMNATQAYMKLHPACKYSTARVNACEKLKILTKTDILQDMGAEFTEDEIRNKLRELMSCNKKNVELGATQLAGETKSMFTKKQEVSGTMNYTVSEAKEAEEIRSRINQRLLEVNTN